MRVEYRQSTLNSTLNCRMRVEMVELPSTLPQLQNEGRIFLNSTLKSTLNCSMRVEYRQSTLNSTLNCRLWVEMVELPSTLPSIAK